MNRLEEHIKTELQNRKIAPSSDAWSKISEEFQLEEKPVSRSRVWWAIAAGFIGIILIAPLFFERNSSVEETDNSVVVEEAVPPPVTGENKNPVLTDETELTTPQNEVVIETLPNTEQVKKEGLFDAPQNKEVLVQNQHSTDKAPLNDVAGVSEMAIHDKLEEVMERVNDMENNALVVSAAEIDSLLLVAQGELLAQKVVQESGSVDAMALLGEVEWELYEDQRNPLFNTLKEGFFRLRTAVADRNN